MAVIDNALHRQWLTVCQLPAIGLWFSPGTPISSTNKTNCHDITEILLKVALHLIHQENILQPYFLSDCFCRRISKHNSCKLGQNLQFVLLVEEIGVPGENHRPMAGNWQTVSHNVVSCTSRHEGGSNLKLYFQTQFLQAWSEFTHLRQSCRILFALGQSKTKIIFGGHVVWLIGTNW
jgi:hypothetical protein